MYIPTSKGGTKQSVGCYCVVLLADDSVPLEIVMRREIFFWGRELNGHFFHFVMKIIQVLHVYSDSMCHQQHAP